MIDSITIRQGLLSLIQLIQMFLFKVLSQIQKSTRTPLLMNFLFKMNINTRDNTLDNTLDIILDNTLDIILDNTLDKHMMNAKSGEMLRVISGVFCFISNLHMVLIK